MKNQEKAFKFATLLAEHNMLLIYNCLSMQYEVHGPIPTRVAYAADTIEKIQKWRYNLVYYGIRRQQPNLNHSLVARLAETESGTGETT